MKTKTQSQKNKKKWLSAAEAGLYDPHAGKTPAKVRITTYIDSDVLDELKKKATSLGIPYQTFLNSLLRQSVSPETKSPSSEEIRKIIREELKKAS